MLSKVKFNILDMETTSVDVKNAEILSVGIIPMLGTRIQIKDYYSTLVKPKRINAKSIKIHGIGMRAIENAPEFEDISNTVFEKLSDSTIVGCHIIFDIEILKKYFKRCGLIFEPRGVDVLKVERFIMRRNGIRRDTDSLDDLLRRYSLDTSYRHSSLADAYQTAQVFQFQLKKLISMGVTLKELLNISKRGDSSVPYYMG